MWKRPTTEKVLFALPLALVLVWALTGAGQTKSLSRTQPFFAPLKAGQLTGMKVEDSDGQKIGTVHNLVLDLRSGELKYVVVGSGGLLGMGPTLRLAPSRVVSARTAKRATLAIYVTTWQWNAAPVFKPSRLASLEDPERAREISSYFQPAGARARNTGHRLSETGSDNAPTNTPRPQLKFGSDLMGMRVVNQKQEKVGEVLDLLVGLGTPRRAFAIIGTGRFFRVGQEYAVPLNALKSTDRENKLLLETDETKWLQAPFFSKKAWDSAAAGGDFPVYRYSNSTDED